MQIATGIVVGGMVVAQGEPLPEGTAFTIRAHAAHQTFEVPPDLEAGFLESIAEADRGDTLSVDELLERLGRIV